MKYTILATGQKNTIITLKQNKEKFEKELNEKEEEIFKRGRNHITHIPKNGDLLSYETASGLEAICGYLYLTDKDRLEKLFECIFEGELDE